MEGEDVLTGGPQIENNLKLLPWPTNNSSIFIISLQPKLHEFVLRKVLCSGDVMTFLFSFFVAGFLWGFFDNFFFWLMEDLGSTKFLMGISLSVGTIAGIPITLFSG